MATASSRFRFRFRFPSLSLSRSPSTTITNLACSRSTTHLSYSRSALYHSSGRIIRMRCKTFASYEPDGDDVSGNETLEMYRAFLEQTFENSSEDELETGIKNLVVFMVKKLRVVDPIAADRLEKRLDELVERLIARFRKRLTEYLEMVEEEMKKDEEEGHGHEDEDDDEMRKI